MAAALDGPDTMARAQLAGMLPLREWLGADWAPVRQDLDRLALAIGPGVGGTPEDADGEPPAQGLHQRGADLRVRAPADGLLALGPQAWSPEVGALRLGATLAGRDRLTVIDRGRRWRLATMTRPPWAERLLCDGRTLWAAHRHGAILRWQPAAPGRPAGGWQPEHNPWLWAAEIGADDLGLWARLVVHGVGYRLRWIAPGRFVMGSPPEEPQRSNDETQHEVT